MDLTELQEIAEKERANFKPIRIRCCMAAGCLSSGSVAVKESLEKVTEETGLADKVEVCSVGCMGLCCQGPLVEVDNVEAQGLVTRIYEKVTSENAPSIIAGLDGGEVKVQTGDLQQPFLPSNSRLCWKIAAKLTQNGLSLTLLLMAIRHFTTCCEK